MSPRITGQGQGTQAIDVEAALTRLGGDRAFLVRLARMLVQQAEQELPQIEQAITQDDVVSLVHLAHSLKGASASLSAEPMRQATHRLEMLGRSGQLDGAPEGLLALQRAVEDLREAVSGWS